MLGTKFLPLLLMFFGTTTVNGMVMTCYYRFRNPPLSLVNGSLCSHIILIGESFVDPLGHFQHPPEDTTKQFMTIKKNYPATKLLLCVTGKSEDFSTLVSSPSNVLRFANESSAYLRRTGLEGLDIDWEFPVWGKGSRIEDRYGLTTLFKALRLEFGSSLLLTAAVSGPPTITRVAYDVNGMNKYVDLVQVMNYDFHVFSYLHPFVGFNAPLRKLRGEPGVIGQMNSESSMKTWRLRGLHRNITVFGIPTYNTAFRLVNSFLYKPYSPAEGTVEGYGTRAVICDILRHRDRYSYVWNNQAASAYVHGTDKLWISIEDERSVTEKAEYAKQLGVAGVMVFHIGADDFYGSCGNGTYPLLNAIYDVISN